MSRFPGPASALFNAMPERGSFASALFVRGALTRGTKGLLFLSVSRVSRLGPS